MQATFGHTRAGDEQFPFAVICARVERLAGGGGEHVAGVLPQVGGAGPFAVLFGVVSLEQCHQFVGEADDPVAGFGFRGAGVLAQGYAVRAVAAVFVAAGRGAPVFPFGPKPVAAHGECAGRLVDVRPP
jgi:hypothetical protein